MKDFTLLVDFSDLTNLVYLVQQVLLPLLDLVNESSVFRIVDLVGREVSLHLDLVQTSLNGLLLEFRDSFTYVCVLDIQVLDDLFVL
jgi:hypothetical protein